MRVYRKRGGGDTYVQLRFEWQGIRLTWTIHGSFINIDWQISPKRFHR